MKGKGSGMLGSTCYPRHGEPLTFTASSLLMGCVVSYVIKRINRSYGKNIKIILYNKNNLEK